MAGWTRWANEFCRKAVNPLTCALWFLRTGRWRRSRGSDNCQPWGIEVRLSALNHVVHLGHHWLLESDAELSENRYQGGPEGIEVLLRFPNVEDLDRTI
jgi:hypothetical protein